MSKLISLLQKTVNNVYSTNETKVGTWYNGKTIYRKVVSGTTANTGHNVDLLFDVDEIVNYNIVVQRDGGQKHPITGNMSQMASFPSAHANPLFKIANTNTLSLYITLDQFANQPFYGWIEYTKTGRGGVVNRLFSFLGGVLRHA